MIAVVAILFIAVSGFCVCLWVTHAYQIAIKESTIWWYIFAFTLIVIGIVCSAIFMDPMVVP